MRMIIDHLTAPTSGRTPSLAPPYDPSNEVVEAACSSVERRLPKDRNRAVIRFGDPPTKRVLELRTHTSRD
jgi:hypothetical protein